MIDACIHIYAFELGLVLAGTCEWIIHLFELEMHANFAHKNGMYMKRAENRPNQPKRLID